MVTGFYLRRIRGPYWLGSNSDPEYAYLFNSVLILYGKIPFLVEHPGTPLEVFGAVIVRAVYAAVGRGDLVGDVVERPELYLGAVHLSLLVAASLALLAAGLIVLWQTGRIGPALLVQVMPWLSVSLIEELSRVRPEVMLLSIVAIFSALVVAIVEGWDRGRRGGGAVAVGILTGIAVATKFTALPLAVIPLLLLRDARRRKIFLLMAAAAFLACIAPVWPKIPSMGKWVLNLAIHAGTYGSGSPSLVYPSRYLPALWALVTTEAITGAVALVSLGLWALERAREVKGNSTAGPSDACRRALLAVGAMQILQFVLVAKHPSPHYLAPASAMLGLNLYLMWRYRNAVRHKALLAGGAILLLSLAAFEGRTFAARVNALVATRGEREVAVRAVENFNGGSDCTKIYSYGTSASAYALQFGNLFSKFSGLDLSDRLRARYPKVLFDQGGFVIKSFEWREEINLRDLVLLESCVLLQGPPRDMSLLPVGVQGEIVTASAAEVVYRIRPRTRSD
jgi:hypothetical protein